MFDELAEAAADGFSSAEAGVAPVEVEGEDAHSFAVFRE